MTAFFLMIQKLSSTYHFQTFGGMGVELMADSSISSMRMLATTGLTGPATHSTSVDMFSDVVLYMK